MQNTAFEQTKTTTISIGSDPIDKALVGGLPLGSLTLVEGPSRSGKSVVIQHFAFGALMAELGVAYYVSGMGEEELVKQMDSLYLEVRTDIGEGQLIIYPITDYYDGREDPNVAMRKLRKHMEDLSWDMNVIIIDSVTNNFPSSRGATYALYSWPLETSTFREAEQTSSFPLGGGRLGRSLRLTQGRL